MVNMVREQDAIWKQYPDYDFIEVSNFGEIRTKDRYVTCKNGSKRFVKGIILKQRLNNKGYMYVAFSVNNKQVDLLVHRAVAICFIPNPDNYPQVNHKDNDRTNNSVNNLEWCTNQYNQDYRENFGTSAAEILGRPVIAINLETSEVLWFKSQSEAARQLDVNSKNINGVVKGKRNKAGGYWFCYVDENVVEKVRGKFGNEIANKVEGLVGDLF